jgi:hydrogenase maturation protein HypF
MTSGNRRDEPIARTNSEAEERLADIADGFLFHNREIHNRADDSIARVLNVEPRMNADERGCDDGAKRSSVQHRTAAQIIRRARGFAPQAIPTGVERCVFAAGAELKSTFALSRRGEAVLSPYLGDLDDERTLASYAEALAKYLRLLDLQPEAVACDLHPDYLSTRFAEEYAHRNGLALYRIQHHEAHVASVLAEHRWQSGEPVLGVAFDGTGFGADGAIWGGEFFVFEPAGARRRVAHLQYFPLPGGDAVAREVWRVALSLLRHCGMTDRPVGSLTEVPERQRAAVLRLLDGGVNCPQTSSMGRLFDAAAVLAGLGAVADYEAEAAMRLEAACGEDAAAPYPCVLTDGWPAQVLLDPLVREMAADAGRPARLAARLHAWAAETIVLVAERARQEEGTRVVGLSGGVFQNRILAETTVARLRARGFSVLLNHRAPPNDGGIALGQVWLAARQRKAG